MIAYLFFVLGSCVLVFSPFDLTNADLTVQQKVVYLRLQIWLWDGALGVRVANYCNHISLLLIWRIFERRLHHIMYESPDSAKMLLANCDLSIALMPGMWGFECDSTWDAGTYCGDASSVLSTWDAGTCCGDASSVLSTWGIRRLESLCFRYTLEAAAPVIFFFSGEYLLRLGLPIVQQALLIWQMIVACWSVELLQSDTDRGCLCYCAEDKGLQARSSAWNQEVHIDLNCKKITTWSFIKAMRAKFCSLGYSVHTSMSMLSMLGQNLYSRLIHHEAYAKIPKMRGHCKIAPMSL